MIKVVAKRYLKSGALEAYTALVRSLVDQTRAEPGCVDYGFFYAPEQTLAVMIETWESRDALNRHLERIVAQGWPEKLNAFADPDKPGGVEQYEQIY